MENSEIINFYVKYLNENFSRRDFNFNVLPQGVEEIDSYLIKTKSIFGERSERYLKIKDAMNIAKECIARGIVFLPPNIEKSDPDNYISEDGNIRIPL